MGTLINFLMENYIYVVFVVVLLILALIGYIVDTAKTTKLKKDLTKEEDTKTSEIPLVNIDSTVKLGDTVNKMAMNSSVNVNKEPLVKPENTKEEPPKLGTLK